MNAAVADLKAHLSAYLKKVKAGREVVITERGKPVARLVPIQPGAVPRDRLEQELVEKGVLRRGRVGALRVLLEPPAGDEPISGVLDALLAERAEGR